ncbi:T9SS type A sorting domain-containing protein [bacterium]|nr:T9SS type A sorting domain-containing protein [bacterium]
MKQRTSRTFKKIIHITCPLWMMLCPILCFTVSGFAQPSPDTLWTRWFGGEYGDAAYDVLQTSDGGYVVAGHTYSFGRGTYLIKLNTDGDTLWTRVHEEYPDIQFTQTKALKQTSDGGFIITGEGRVNNTNYPCLIRTDESGNLLWAKAYEHQESWIGKDVCETSDGGYAILTNVTMGYHSNIGLIKTNSSGDTSWTRLVGSANTLETCGVFQTDDGGYVVGASVHPEGEVVRFYLVKTDASGYSEWEQSYGPVKGVIAYDIAQASDGGYAMAGMINHGDDTSGMYVVRVNAVGDTLWTRVITLRHMDCAHGIEKTDDGGFIVCGTTTLLSPDATDIALMKFNNSGDTLWTRTYGLESRENYSTAAAVRPTLDGGYIIVGSALNDVTTSNDIYIVKTGPEISAASELHSLPDVIALHQNYPNPFNPSTRIAFTLSKTGPVSLKVYDLLGREIVTLMDGVQTAGNHSVFFDGSDLPSGIYFTRLESSELHQVKKMVLLK